MKRKVLRQIGWLGLAAVLTISWAGCAEEETNTAETGEESASGESVLDGDESTTESSSAEGDAEQESCVSDEDCSVPESSCQIVSCNTSSGKCEPQDLGDGADCQAAVDGCIFSGVCNAGECTNVDGGTLGCDDGNACTEDLCDETTGCFFEEIEGCCQTGGVLGCDDGNSCTEDFCDEETGCVFQAIEGCCESDSDCISTDACQVGSCADAVCVYEFDPDCCQSNEDCDDGIVCTLDICSLGGSCTNELKPDCCSADGDCDDGAPCTSDICLEDGSCENVPLEGCCATVEDCDNSNPCNAASCSEGTCSYTPDPFCCQFDSDCDDQLPCTLNICDPETNTCTFEDDPGCCFFGDDCNDGNPCTANDCVKPDGDETATGVCVDTPLNGCCYEMEDGSPSSCDDDNPCTDDSCNLDVQLCEHTPNYGEGCCDESGVCDDGNPCTYDSCDKLLCATSPVPGCCLEDADCGEPDACSTVSCVNNLCEVAPIANCCEDSGDCTAQGVCFTGTCVESECSYAPVDNCCDAPGTCDDGDVCTQDTCNINSNQCLFSPIDGCLECVDGACDDGNPCTSETCNGLGLCDIVETGDCVSTEPICIMSNPGGASGTCNLELVATDVLSIASTAYIVLEFDPSIGLYEGPIFSVSCPDSEGNDTCDEGKMPTGHDFSIEELAPGKLAVTVEFPNASFPITEALKDGDAVTGNSFFFSLTLGLPNDVADNSLPIYVGTADFTAGLTPLDVALELNTFVTTLTP